MLLPAFRSTDLLFVPLASRRWVRDMGDVERFCSAKFRTGLAPCLSASNVEPSNVSRSAVRKEVFRVVIQATS